jgi:hypothetical protein
MFAPRSHLGEVPANENREMDITTDVIIVLHPAAEDVAESQRLAPRLASLQGMTVGFIDTHKRNANVYFEELGRLLHVRSSRSVWTAAATCRSAPSRQPLYQRPACPFPRRSGSSQARRRCS